MSAALSWHQRPGLAVRCALLVLVLAAHALLLGAWPVGRPHDDALQITPVRVLMVERPAESKPLSGSTVEPVPTPAAATGHVKQTPAQQQAAQSVAPAAPPSPTLVQSPAPAPGMAAANATASTTAAAAKPPGGESSAAPLAAASTATNTSSQIAAAPGAGSSMKDLCPHTVKAVPPVRATQAGLGGMVLVRATIQGGRVRRVEILKSEPGGLYDAAVRMAMAQYVCRDQGALEVLAEQWFEFKVVE